MLSSSRRAGTLDQRRGQRGAVAAQVEIEVDRGVRLIELQRIEPGRIVDARDRRHQAVAGGKREIVPQIIIAIDIDLRGQLAVVIKTDKEMDVRGALAMAAQQIL